MSFLARSCSFLFGVVWMSDLLEIDQFDVIVLGTGLPEAILSA